MNTNGNFFAESVETPQPQRGGVKEPLHTTEPLRSSIVRNRIFGGLLALGIAVIAIALAGPLAADDRTGPNEADQIEASGPIDSRLESPTLTATPLPGPVASSLAAAIDEKTLAIASEFAHPDLATSRYVDVPTERVLDTRTSATVLAPGGSQDVDLSKVVPAGSSVVVLSVGVAATQGTGAVTIEVDGHVHSVIDVGGAGQMTTNLAFIPTGGDQTITAATEGGGHIVVDVVGYFTASGPTRSGRFVAVEPARLTRLVTEVDGREATVEPLGFAGLPESGVGSVLVRVRADVGAEGGVVRLGETFDQLTEAMMWGPTVPEDRTRLGTTIVSLGELEQLALTYDGGAVLDLDILGYFTDDSAPLSTVGLFVPSYSDLVFDDVIPARSTTIVSTPRLPGELPNLVGRLLVTVEAVAQSPGQLILYSRSRGLSQSATAELGAGVSRRGLAVVELDSGGNVAAFSESEAAVKIRLQGSFIG